MDGDPQEEIDLDVSVDSGLQKLIDIRGAGTTVSSPGWLTQLGRLWGGKSVHCPTMPSGAQNSAWRNDGKRTGACTTCGG